MVSPMLQMFVSLSYSDRDFILKVKIKRKQVHDFEVKKNMIKKSNAPSGQIFLNYRIFIDNF